MEQLPDQMPEGCNFYALLQPVTGKEAVIQCFTAAGWKTNSSGEGQVFEIGWGRLTLSEGRPLVLQGWLDRPDDRVGTVLGLLGGSGVTCISQWINAQDQLWREMPFDESMLDPNDPRLPADIKESIRASSGAITSIPRQGKPWWQFW
jgi:hypothetical protein